MSAVPNYNPYTPASPIELGGEGANGPLKGLVKVVCIFFIILGALGLLMTVQNMVGMAIIFSMDEKQFNPMKIFPGAMAIAILIGLINFVVSICLLMGGVLGLQKKRIGATVIRLVSAFMLVFKVVETAYGCVVNYLSIGPTVEQTLKQMPQQPPNGPDMGMLIQIGMFVGIGFTVLIGLVMFFFYLFAFLSYSKQQTLSQFS